MWIDDELGVSSTRVYALLYTSFYLLSDPVLGPVILHYIHCEFTVSIVISPMFPLYNDASPVLNLDDVLLSK